MILSSDELEILEYLKSWNGTYVSMVEICRCAGGRRRFREEPHWAKNLMGRLVDARMVEVNDRGHYRFLIEQKAAKVVEDYFPADAKAPEIVGENYFPTSEPAKAKSEPWIAPDFAHILKKAGKKFGGQKAGA